MQLFWQRFGIYWRCFLAGPSTRGKREIVQRVLKKLPLTEVNEARKFWVEKDGPQIQFCGGTETASAKAVG